MTYSTTRICCLLGGNGGIFKVVFNEPKSIEAIRLYRRVDCCSDRYNKLSVTVRVSFEASYKTNRISITLNLSKGTNYTWRKCTTSDEGDPFKAPDSKSKLALKFPLENATKVTEIQFDFNAAIAQIAELEFDFSQNTS